MANIATGTITLDIANTGAANIIYDKVNINMLKTWQDNQKVLFVFDGIGWEILNPMIATSRVTNAVMAKAKILEDDTSCANIQNHTMNNKGFKTNTTNSMSFYGIVKLNTGLNNPLPKKHSLSRKQRCILGYSWNTTMGNTDRYYNRV